MKPPKTNLQHLISFYLISVEQSFVSAADKLCLTQPAVTMHIKALEQQFGIKLFSVKKKRVSLTEAGEKLFGYAKNIFDQATAAEEYLLGFRQNYLRVGIACSATLHLMPLFALFNDKNPLIKVVVREAPSLKLIEEIVDFQHDLCFVGSSIVSIPACLKVLNTPDRSEMVLVTSPKNVIFDQKEIKWKDVTDHPLILQREGSAARSALLNFLQSQGLSPTIAVEVDNIESGKLLAIQNKGIAFMFLPNVESEVTAGKLAIVPVGQDQINVGTDIILHEDVIGSPVIKKFLTVVEEYFEYKYLE